LAREANEWFATASMAEDSAGMLPGDVGAAMYSMCCFVGKVGLLTGQVSPA
jgi:hypothetical protein